MLLQPPQGFRGMPPAAEVRELLTRFNLRARKSLGQNFLVDDAALDRIAAAAELTPDDTVLEIGPGLGTLTRRLAQAAGHIVAVEIDQNLIPPLRYALAAHPNVELIHGDILRLDPAVLIQPGRDAPAARPQDYPTTRLLDYKVVANLPYYITSAVTRHLLEATL